ncbi:MULTISPECIES: MFS transporter [Brevibacterium]|uniref:Predicted arabinose efflux permease, MFS family n=2 Tax=Brevibacterium antiquum TaxID=234835 RepID=A0A2H1K0M4_9MICO|nr:MULTISPECIES: MFS transporter [Brevibacterium]SMX83730.1 Predicted arabinose efflux permease, MFS family [Brevibacterium antiquum]SMX93270.1 Predicted arabinose efflux permease, MFS family [Brevibacterium antiquum CNRZ 918]HCG54973.1 MFS transporter [Brevibacterium sp.]
MAHTFRSLAEPNYRHWFAGALISNTGTWMQRTAQDWIVLTYLTNNNASALGITMALQMGPQLIMFPFAGAIADKFSKRRLLMVTQTLLGAVGLLLFVLVITDVIVLWHVYMTALALGILATLDNPSRQAFVSELVGEKLLPNAVSLNSASFNGARMIGPAVAGVLTALIGAGPVFLISGLGFAATLTVLIRLDQTRLHPSGRRGTGGILGGFKYLRRRPDVAIVLLVLFIVATFGFNFNIYTATMAKIEFGQDASGFGLLNSVMAIGSVTGALISAKREKPRLRFIFGAAGGFGLAVGTASLIPNYYVFAASLMLVGFASLTMMTSANAYVQTTTPAHYRGRVMAIYAAVVLGGTPIGAPLAGWVADMYGPRMAMGVGAASGIIAFGVGLVWMVVSKNLRLSYDPRSRIRLHLSYHGRP